MKCYRPIKKRSDRQISIIKKTTHLIDDGLLKTSHREKRSVRTQTQFDVSKSDVLSYIWTKNYISPREQNVCNLICVPHEGNLWIQKKYNTYIHTFGKLHIEKEVGNDIYVIYTAVDFMSQVRQCHGHCRNTHTQTLTNIQHRISLESR